MFFFCNNRERVKCRQLSSTCRSLSYLSSLTQTDVFILELNGNRYPIFLKKTVFISRCLRGFKGLPIIDFIGLQVAVKRQRKSPVASLTNSFDPHSMHRLGTIFLINNLAIASANVANRAALVQESNGPIVKVVASTSQPTQHSKL